MLRRPLPPSGGGSLMYIPGKTIVIGDAADIATYIHASYAHVNTAMDYGAKGNLLRDLHRLHPDIDTDIVLSTDFSEIHPWLVVWHGNEIPVLQYLHDHNYVCCRVGINRGGVAAMARTTLDCVSGPRRRRAATGAQGTHRPLSPWGALGR